eukprot:g49180.t1
MTKRANSLPIDCQVFSLQGVYTLAALRLLARSLSACLRITQPIAPARLRGSPAAGGSACPSSRPTGVWVSGQPCCTSCAGLRPPQVPPAIPAWPMPAAAASAFVV